jgi:hypothetical protein
MRSSFGESLAHRPHIDELDANLGHILGVGNMVERSITLTELSLFSTRNVHAQ